MTKLMGIAPGRVSAFDALLRIETKRAFSSIVLPQVEETLSPTDRGLCHELVLGVLRRAIFLDRLIDMAANGKALDIEVRIALQLGLFQLLFLNKIPAYAAVNDSVNLVARAKKTSARGFVNAILRKADKLAEELKFVDHLDRVSVETSHPRWLIEKWTRDFGADRAKQIARANNVPPAIAFRKTLKSHELIDGGRYRESSNVRGCYVAERFDEELRRLADGGLIYFQDEASQMVAAAVEIPKGGKFLDVCAAPGGKTGAIVAGSASNGLRANADLSVAGDLYAQRVQFLRENLENQGISTAKIVQYDAADGLPFADETFDSILLDAPCSGTGTIRHNPEIRYFVQAGDFERLQKTQLAILTNASKVLKQGGSLVYSTCSLEREENEDVVEAFLAEHRNFESIGPNVPEKFAAGDGSARTFPDRDDMDGFFLAVFRRN